MDGVEVTVFATGGRISGDRMPRWAEDVPQGSYLPLPPGTPARSREIWWQTAAALNRLLPEIKAAADRLEDGQRLGHALMGRPIVDETRAWPPYIRRASGRITWARPVGRML